jgi:hypothetical protein
MVDSFRENNLEKSGVARFFLVCTLYPNRKKCTIFLQNVPNGDKISQISIKYSKWP